MYLILINLDFLLYKLHSSISRNAAAYIKNNKLINKY